MSMFAADEPQNWELTIIPARFRNIHFTEESWRAHFRLLFVCCGLLFTVIVAAVIERGGKGAPGWGDWESWFWWIVWTIVSWQSVVFLIWAVCPLLIAFKAGGTFFAELYAIPDRDAALSHYFNVLFGLDYDYVSCSQGKLRNNDPDHPVSRAGGPAYLIVEDDTAVVLEENGYFTRVVGREFTFLDPFETIREVVDLRPQVRTKGDLQVSAVTRDGIPVQVSVEVEFMIQPAAADPHNNPNAAPFPFFERSVKRAVYHKSVIPFKDEAMTSRWEDLVLHRTRLELRRMFSEYPLDRLVEPEDGNARAPLELADTPRRQIQSKLHKHLNEGKTYHEDAVEHAPDLTCLKDIGVTILRVSLGKLTIDARFSEARQEVLAGRTEVWKMLWENRAAVTEAEGQAESLRLKEIARGQAQMEMIRAIARGIKGTAGANPRMRRDLLALRMIEALEQMSLEPWAQALVPQETHAMIRLLHSFYNP